MDFENTEIAFRARSNLDLRKAQLLLKSFAFPTLVRTGPKLVNLAMTLRLPITPVIKATIFDVFCGGTSIEDSEPVVQALAKHKVGSILDYSVEAAEREEDFDRTVEVVCKVIERAAKDHTVPFAVFKPTAIGRFGLLEKISAGQALTPTELDEERRMACRFETLCGAAADHGVRILVDAEESWIQDAIDRYVLDLMRRHNRERAIVYNTAQMYRVDRLAWLEKLLAQARAEGFKVGIKLVRGAYMEKERRRAKEHGVPSPIQPDKASTDRAYDAALQLLVDAADVASLCAGTHNERSNRLLVELMRAKGVKPTDGRFDFSQLLGMSDNLTFNLAAAGFRASKYVPFGPVRAVLPYLFRRAEENSSIQGQAGRELGLIERELRRRLASS